MDPKQSGMATVRLALIQPKFDRSGGAERYAWGLAHALVARGHEVHLFGRRGADLPAGAMFHRVPTLPFGRALKTYSFWRSCERLLRGQDFDVVQGFAKTTCQTVHRAGGGIHRAFLERRGNAAQTRYDRVVLRIEDALFRSPRLRAIIVPARWVEDEIRRIYPATVAPIRVVPNGVDTTIFRPEGREGDRARLLAEIGVEPSGLLLFAATNFALKGLGGAVEALALMPDAHLVVAGGDNPAAFQSQARDLGVLSRMHFLGVRREMEPLYRAADVLIHPTRWDTFGNVIFEALACGTPVVTSDRAGAADILGEGGTVVPYPCAPEELARAVNAWLGAGPQGRCRARSVAEDHSLDRHTARVESLYRESIEASGRRVPDTERR